MAEDPRLRVLPDIHGHAKGEHKPYADERPIPYSARLIFLWFFHAARRGAPRYMMVTDHVNYLTFEDPAAVSLVRRALRLAGAGDVLGAAEAAGVDIAQAQVVSDALRAGMRFTIGAEVDNDPRSRPDAPNVVEAMRPDGIIRSIHFLPISHPQTGEEFFWPFDNPEFAHFFDQVGVEETWERYVETLLEAVATQPTHIVGHLHVPGKFGHWCEPAKLEQYENRVLDLCSERDIAIELNARIFYRSSDEALKARHVEIYRRMLRKAKERDVGIALGSDAHSPRDQGRGFDILLRLLDETETNEIVFPIAGKHARVALRPDQVRPRPRVLAAAAAAAAAAKAQADAVAQAKAQEQAAAAATAGISAPATAPTVEAASVVATERAVSSPAADDVAPIAEPSALRTASTPAEIAPTPEAVAPPPEPISVAASPSAPEPVVEAQPVAEPTDAVSAEEQDHAVKTKSARSRRKVGDAVLPVIAEEVAAPKAAEPITTARAAKATATKTKSVGVKSEAAPRSARSASVESAASASVKTVATKIAAPRGKTAKTAVPSGRAKTTETSAATGARAKAAAKSETATKPAKSPAKTAGKAAPVKAAKPVKAATKAAATKVTATKPAQVKTATKKTSAKKAAPAKAAPRKTATGAKAR